MESSHPQFPALELTDLCIRRGDVTILSDLNWRVAQGQHWALIGPNGCGKTSLLSTLSGLLQASSGSMRVLGKKYGEYDWRRMRQRIGIVSSALRQLIVDDEIALETVASGKRAMLDFRIEEMTKEEGQKARSILSLLDAGHLTNRTWRVLSQGERQRVLIGRALMADPALLILDEPCAGMDPVNRERFLERVEHIAQGPNAPSIILVTHHIEEIIPSITHVLALTKGRAIAKGLKSEILTGDTLSQAFGAPIEVEHAGGRYTLKGVRVNQNDAR